MEKKLSIVIVTYNSERLIFDCLNSIFKNNDIGDELEIIIVDNCSDDRERVFKRIKSEYSFDIVLINSPVNKGYGHGNNQGVKSSNSPLIIVMNPDVRLVEPIFRKIIKKFDINQNIGMMGVRFINRTSHLYYKPEDNNLIKMLFGSFFIKIGCYNINEMFFSGSFLIFNKKSFIKAGSFDENIFMFYEEPDISNRILKIGKQVLLADNIYVLHLAHGRAVNNFLLKVGAKSRHYYFEKYQANIIDYYKNRLIYYRLKYAVAVLLNNKLKKAEFFAWIKMCKNRGKID